MIKTNILFTSYVNWRKKNIVINTVTKIIRIVFVPSFLGLYTRFSTQCTVARTSAKLGSQRGQKLILGGQIAQFSYCDQTNYAEKMFLKSNILIQQTWRLIFKFAQPNVLSVEKSSSSVYFIIANFSPTLLVRDTLPLSGRKRPPEGLYCQV